MEEGLQEIIRRILSEIESSGVCDFSIKHGLVGFAESFKRLGTDERASEAGKSYDSAALHFIETVVDRENLHAVQLYLDFYESAKKGEVSIEPFH
jgi:hypothetical protein